MTTLRTHRREDPDFEDAVRALENRLDEDPGPERDVREILDAVRREGDVAVLRYTERFDGVILAADDMEIAPDAVAAAAAQCDPKLLDALKIARDRIAAFHEKELRRSWRDESDEGVVLGQKFTPVERAGLYVPGGKAAYPSSVLMTAVPAKVAGVDEVVMVTPVKAEGPNPVVLAAAHLSGVDRVFGVGGAQAIAALAYGTETIPRVDKIVGPGNVYVATAKRLVQGRVSIDSIAGPSEILVIADGSVPADWIAADLLSQAEHDELAMPILVATDAAYAARVGEAVGAQVDGLRNAEIARRSIAERARCFVVRDLDEAVEVSNRLAPEHLELAVRDPEALLARIRNAGAIFLGAYTPEAVGDYVAGPNHVLPTGGTARFYSPLGVDDFLKKSSVIGLSARALGALADVTTTLARAEGLDGHAAAVDRRTNKE